MTDTVATRTRPVGATASMGKRGYPVITSATGGEIQIATGVSEAGFNPIDLLYSSLAACMAMSVRIVVNRMGLQDRFEDVSVSVSGSKAAEGLSRIGQFDIHFDIKGDFDAETLKIIAETAELEVCTVSNTIRSDPSFVIGVANT